MRDLETNQRNCGKFPSVSFCLTDRRLGAEEVNNLEMPSANKNVPTNSAFSRQKTWRGVPSKT